MSSFSDRFEKLRNKYIISDTQEKSEQQDSLQLQIEIAQKIKELNQKFIIETKSNNFTQCTMLVEKLKELFIQARI